MNSDDLRWFHVILTTYGSWLPGDSRGFRTRKHREHVEGDYKNPPRSGRYESLARNSIESLVRDPIVLSSTQQQHVGELLLDSLRNQAVIVACIAVAAQHVHLLAKLSRKESRKQIGAAKRHVWHELCARGYEGKLWAKGAKFVLIIDRKHQLNAYDYILKHAEQGAYVLRYSDESK